VPAGGRRLCSRRGCLWSGALGGECRREYQGQGQGGRQEPKARSGRHEVLVLLTVLLRSPESWSAVARNRFTFGEQLFSRIRRLPFSLSWSRLQRLSAGAPGLYAAHDDRISLREIAPTHCAARSISSGRPSLRRSCRYCVPSLTFSRT